MPLRVNIGCGLTPTFGWRNFDNSPSLRLSRIPLLAEFLLKLRILDSHQYKFIRFARENNIEYGDATRGLPVKDASVDVLYSSHMLEHLDRNQVRLFLGEALRKLCPGGILRIAVPDIGKIVQKYTESGDADALVESTSLCAPPLHTFPQRVRLLLVGARNHQWMYDGKSLCRVLQDHGLVKAEVMPVGQTRIHAHEPLDLQERASESVYVEAEK